MFIFSFIVFIALTLWAMWLGGEISLFWNLPSFLLVIPPAILFAVGATSSGELKMTFTLLFDDGKTPSAHQAKISCRFLSVLGNSALLLGLLMTTLGLVSMGSYINAENIRTHLGASFGVALLTSIYAIFLKILCYISEQKIQHKLDNTRD
jgi:chemotaxis protein MotA